jgi:hypothetical protein
VICELAKILQSHTLLLTTRYDMYFGYGCLGLAARILFSKQVLWFGDGHWVPR